MIGLSLYFYIADIVTHDSPDVAATSETRASSKNASDSDNSRAGLMAAIRNAGGSGKAGLKSIKERKMEEKKAKQEEQVNAINNSGASGGGDLMSDLANKLGNVYYMRNLEMTIRFSL